MKNIFKILALAVTTVVMVTACTKVADLPYYENGNPVTLTASKTAVTATPADSLNALISAGPILSTNKTVPCTSLSWKLTPPDGISPKKP